MKNKKTTVLGIAAILTGLGGLITSVVSGDMANVPVAIAAIVGGVANVFSKDGTP